jgi:hypothetical protein
VGALLGIDPVNDMEFWLKEAMVGAVCFTLGWITRLVIEEIDYRRKKRYQKRLVTVRKVRSNHKGELN